MGWGDLGTGSLALSATEASYPLCAPTWGLAGLSRITGCGPDCGWSGDSLLPSFVSLGCPLKEQNKLARGCKD